MYCQGITSISVPMDIDQQESCVPVDFNNFKGFYGRECFHELQPRFMEIPLLSVTPREDGLDISGDYGRLKITFQKLEENFAVFSDGYKFELGENNRPIAIHFGDTRLVCWGR